MDKNCLTGLCKGAQRVLVLLSLALLSLPALAQATAYVLLAQSKTYVSSSYAVQNFQDWMTLKPTQEKLPLLMSLTNGSHEAPSYKWFRINIGGYTVASEKNLAGKEQASFDVSGLIPGGNTQVLVEAAGVPGASLSWQIYTPRVGLNTITPTKVNSGDVITITGTNFATDPSQITVTFNDKPGQVIQATATSIQVKVPQVQSSGVTRVQVNVDNNVSRVCEIMVTGGPPTPELLSIDCWMAPPGGQITITGRNFSPVLTQNQVFFSKVGANVLSATDSQLVVEVPNWAYGPSQLNIPVTVSVLGVRSANSLPFDIGPSYHGAIPQFSPN